MAKYFAGFNDTADTTNLTGHLDVDATTVRRFKVYDWNVGCEGAAADNPFLWRILRISGAVTSSAVTPSPLDPADAAALTDAGENVTSNPTLGVELAQVALNQRNTYRWQASPGSELVAPATAGNGMGWQPTTSTALAVTVGVYFDEQ